MGFKKKWIAATVIPNKKRQLDPVSDLGLLYWYYSCIDMNECSKEYITYWKYELSGSIKNLAYDNEIV